MGTSCASNIIPTMTLKIGSRNVCTLNPAQSKINLLKPGDIYPPQPYTYWVVEQMDDSVSRDIILTLDELRSIETGAPITIVNAIGCGCIFHE